MTQKRKANIPSGCKFTVKPADYRRSAKELKEAHDTR